MSAELNAHHWVVLPPLPNRSHWISRLRDAAERANYVLHDWDESQDLNAGARMMLLTISADEARRRQPDDSRIAFILDALDITLPDQMDQTERHHAIQAASRSFAASTTLPHERVFGPDRLASGAVRLFPDFEVAPPGASPAPSGAVAKALQVYTRGEAVWSGSLLTWNTPATHAEGRSTLDLTGRPRIVVYGPYLEMPTGRWKAVFTLSVDAYACRYLFRADWGGIEDYVSQEFRPGRPGVFEIEMVYDWTTQGACEFRLLVMEGVFHGEISMSDLIVSRVD